MTGLFKKISSILSILVFLGGCIVLIGWIFDISALKSISPKMVTMKANTALCFVLTGLSLWLLQRYRLDNRLGRGIARICALVVFLIGFLTLFEYISGFNLGIDQLLFKDDANAILTSHPGRMALNTSINFTIIGIALVLVEFGSGIFFRLAQSLIFIESVASVLSFLGYLYKAAPLYIGPKFSTAMALHTTVLFIAIGISFLFARPDKGFMKNISSDNTGGTIIRRFLPIVILIPIILGWIKLRGERSGWFTNEFGVAFVATANLIIVAVYFYLLCVALNRADDERKKAQEGVARAAEEWQRTFDSMSDIVYIMDIESRIIKVNKTFTDRLGKSLGDVTGKKCYEVMHKGAAHWSSCPLVGTYNDRTSHTEEVDDPSIGMPLLMTTSPLLDEDGKMVGFVHVAKDITQIKKAEEALKEAIDIKEQFISIASHELRSPMGIIRESIEIISDETAGKAGPQVKKFIDIARRNIERLVRLSNNLLNFQKLSMGKFEFNIAEHDIDKTIKEAAVDMEMLAKDKGLEFSINLAEGLPPVRFDKDAITEVVTNLISNSIKFTEKGRITVSSERIPDGVMVSVSDTGPGISEGDMKTLFQPFHQVGAAGEKKGGTGLGLAISKAIIDQHKGRIWAESRRGSGSTFKFFLPLG